MLEVGNLALEGVAITSNLNSSTSASAVMLFLMADSVVVVSSFTGSCLGVTTKLRPFSRTISSYWVNSLLERFFTHWIWMTWCEFSPWSSLCAWLVAEVFLIFTRWDCNFCFFLSLILECCVSFAISMKHMTSCRNTSGSCSQSWSWTFFLLRVHKEWKRTCQILSLRSWLWGLKIIWSACRLEAYAVWKQFSVACISNWI